MGLAAVSKGSESCRAGQCARCAPASRLGAPALPERGLALAPRGWGAASCPGCPWGVLGVCQAPDAPALGAAQAPGGACKGLETLGQGGGFCLPRSSPEGSWLGFSPSSSTERVPLLPWRELGTVPPQQAATLGAQPEARQPKWECKRLWVLGDG